MSADDRAPGWFETVASEVVYDGWGRVRVDRVRMPDGTVADREVVEHTDAVAVVPILDGEVVLVRQYRHPFARYLLELPAGLLDEPGESREEAARRELREEAGLDGEDLEELVTFDNSAGWTTERTTIYLARDVRPAAPREGFQQEAEEADMEVVRLPFEDAVVRARGGGIEDAKTLIGLLLAASRLGAGEGRGAH